MLMLDVRLLPRWNDCVPNIMCDGIPEGVIGIPEGGAIPAAGPGNMREG